MTVVKIKRKLKFENYEKCLEGNQIENKINHLEKKNRCCKRKHKRT